ncbi:hypothetical protein ACWCQ1_43930, partial [Streptomyces sp. NPDC002144]
RSCHPVHSIRCLTEPGDGIERYLHTVITHDHGRPVAQDLRLNPAPALRQARVTPPVVGPGPMVGVDAHSDFHRFDRAGWSHPLLAGTVDLDACQVLGLGWDPGDHSMRHRGERAYGHVYPRCPRSPRRRSGTALDDLAVRA